MYQIASGSIRIVFVFAEMARVLGWLHAEPEPRLREVEHALHPPVVNHERESLPSPSV